MKPPLAVHLTMHPRVASKVRNLLLRGIKKHQRALERSAFVPKPGKMNANAFWVSTLGALVREINVQIGEPRGKKANEKTEQS